MEACLRSEFTEKNGKLCPENAYDAERIILINRYHK